MKKFLIVIGLLVSTVPVFADAGRTVRGSFSNKIGLKGYQLYLPKNQSINMPLFVVLHGCFMTGDQMASGTGLNLLADERGFLVLYPEQTYQDNSWKCWNWFDPKHQKRDSGELAIVAEMTQKIIKDYALDPSKVFVMGLSAGGAFASNLTACYSDVFKGVMVHSGLEFRAAQSENEAHQVTKNGSTQDLLNSAQTAVACSPKREEPVPTLVFHGTTDPYVNTVNADHVIEQFRLINAILDPRLTLEKKESKIEQDGHKFNASVTDLASSDGNVVLRKVMIEGMGHGWSGGNPVAPYMESRGVNASKLTVEFFLGKQSE